MSKKTPKSVKPKIKSGHNKRFDAYSLWPIALLPIVLIFAWFLFKPDPTKELEKTCLIIEQKCFQVEIADSKEEQIKGLSDRDKLDKDIGMLFVFDQAEEQCLWMKDMNFSVDMVWANKQRKIIKIIENVSPDTYPESFCQEDTKYVLEFNRGFAARHGLKAGSALQF